MPLGRVLAARAGGRPSHAHLMRDPSQYGSFVLFLGLIGSMRESLGGDGASRTAQTTRRPLITKGDEPWWDHAPRKAVIDFVRTVTLQRKEST